jgi:hypothetical protein
VRLKKCTISDFYDADPYLFVMNGLPDMLCPDLSEGDNFTIAGLFTDNWFQFLELNVKLKPQMLGNMTVVRNFMNQNPLFASIFFLDTGINYDNITHPLPSLYNYYYTSVSMFDYKFTEIFLSNLEFSNDENLLFTTSHKTIETIHDRTTEYSVPIQDRNELYGINSTYALGVTKFIIKASPKYYIVQRTYQKIPEFLANMSGIISQVLFLLMFTITYTNRKSAENKIMADVMKYKGKQNFDINYLTEVFPRINSKRKKSVARTTNENEEEGEEVLNLNKLKAEVIMTTENKQSVNISKQGKLASGNSLVVEDAPKVEASSLPKVENYSRISEVNHNRDEDDVVQESLESRKSNSESIEEQSPPIIPYIINPNRFRHPTLQSVDISLYERKKRLSRHTTKLSVVSFLKKKDIDIEIDKEMTNQLFKLNTFEILLIKLGCCCKRFRQRKRIVKAGEYKIFFYLDVLTYIKKMQEVDIIKYLLLSADQLYLFNFLSKPSISTNDITSMVYTEFQTEQKRTLTLTKEEIHRMKDCYQNILGQNELTYQDKKLVNLIDAEIDSMRV